MVVDRLFGGLLDSLFGGSAQVFVIGSDGSSYQHAGGTARDGASSHSSLPVIDLYDAGGSRFTRLQEFDEGQLVRLLREDPAVRWEAATAVKKMPGVVFATLVPDHFSAELGSVRAELHRGCGIAPHSQPVLRVSESDDGSHAKTYSGAGIATLYRHVAGRAYR